MKRLREHLKEVADGMPEAAPDWAVPKIPRLIQNEIDRLIKKGKYEGLLPAEQVQLDEALDYLDDLAIFELERLKVTSK